MPDSANLDVRQQVAVYLQRGWRCVPLRPYSKSPVHSNWPQTVFEESEIKQHFSPKDNVGIILGAMSGGLVDVDLDCAEAIDLADQYLPPTPAITGRPSAPRSHRWYIAENATTQKHTESIDGSMIVELRSTGAQTVVGPSVHPSGETYETLAGEPAIVPAPMLAACVNALADAVIEKRGTTSPLPTVAYASSLRPTQSLTANNLNDRAIAYLAAMPPAIAGAGGHSQTYAAATALVHGFGLEPKTALQILSGHYNSRCDPPWSEQELQHKINQASTKTHQRPFGWLRDETRNESLPDVDLSVFATQTQVTLKAKTKEEADIQTDDASDEPTPTEIANPGHLPERLLRIPGFIERVMDFTMANAPYPNLGLAFCGAMALQSFLAGRRVSTTGDLRTNLYLLALASSGTGKEFPRKVNSQVLYQIGMSHALGDKFASGEGIQDALLRSGRMLFQNDEMDGVLRQINLDRDNSRESIPNILLTLYTSAGDVYPIRVKANQKEAMYVEQPHLTLFGTATPQHFYESLSKRMLTNGFFARLNIIDVGRRGKGQTPGSVREMPQSIIDIAGHWADAKTKVGNLQTINPDPRVVEFTSDAAAEVNELRLATESEYEIAEQAGDEAARAAWSRTCEHATKLALIYACSVNYRSPVIDIKAMTWASEFALHQTRRQLFLASVHVAENPFHAECLRFKKRLADAPDRIVNRRAIMRSMTVKLKDFEQIVQTLIHQEEIEPIMIPSKTKPAQAYRLL